MCRKKRKILTLAFLCASIALPFNAAAADTNKDSIASKTKTTENTDAVTDEYAMEDVVVTAQRVGKSDIDIPAATTVITADQIVRAGYRNAYEAIDRQLGSSGMSMGSSGQDFGTSSSRISLRGYDRGTLVLVNGAPINLNNYANPENIPASMIERIEIVRGAASTLYGGEAMGGVVNIILKKPSGEGRGTVSATFGNYDKKTEISYGNDRFLFDISKEWTKNVPHSSVFGLDKLSWTDYWTGKGQKNHFSMLARLTDELNLNYDYTESTIRHGGSKYKESGNGLQWDSNLNTRFDDYRHTANLTYEGKTNGVKAVLGYNYRKIDAYDNIKNKPLDSSNSVFDGEILDVQKVWKVKSNTILGGYSWRREAAENIYSGASATRFSNALYTSYTHPFSTRFTMTFGLRGEFIKDAQKDQNVYLPQIQTDYKLNRDTAWYVNIGKAFQMPEIDEAINHVNADTSGLRPEEGWNYETGVKIKHGSESWKIALYYMEMKNKLGWMKNNITWYTVNRGDFRNLGLEAEYNRQINAIWSVRVGGSISNPEIKDPTDGNAWKQDAARLQGTVSVDYTKAKWDGSLEFEYLGDREYYAPVSYDGITPIGCAQNVPSSLQLSLNLGYQCDKNNRITLGVYNLLDKDIYTSRYGTLDLPRNYRLTFTHNF